MVHGRQKQIAFSLIGGRHHYLHIVPVAAALSRRENIAVTIYVPHGPDHDVLQDLLRELDAGPVAIVTSKKLMAAWWPDALVRRWNRMKLPQLLLWARSMRKADAIVAAERTSTILKRLPGHCPMMIHTPHGVGDREKGFEKRILLYDHVIVGGVKNRQRMIAAGVVTPLRCHVAGGIKLSTINRLFEKNRPMLFNNDRPIILYNAHFDDALASWASHAEVIIAAVAASDDYNLIVAPHIRRFAGKSPEEKARWQNLAVPDKIIVDLDSERLTDMTYTLASDIYLGDVSSQIYEFISRPRAAVFINSHDVAWQGDENYRMWQLGEVVDTGEDVLTVVKEAIANHPMHLLIQTKYGRAAFGDIELDAAEHAAEIIELLLEEDSSPARS